MVFCGECLCVLIEWDKFIYNCSNDFIVEVFYIEVIYVVIVYFNLGRYVVEV